MTKMGMDPIYVRYVGLTDFDALYAAVIDWCKSYGYIWQETTYKHKIPSPKGAEQEWVWELEKEVTDYIKYSIKMEAHVWDLNEIIVEKGGKKKSLSSGRFEVIIHGTLITNWQNKWKKNKFTEKLGEIYESVIMKKDIESLYGDQLAYRIWNLQALMKKFFDMQAKWHTYKTYLREN